MTVGSLYLQKYLTLSQPPLINNPQSDGAYGYVRSKTSNNGL